VSKTQRIIGALLIVSYIWTANAIALTCSLADLKQIIIER